MGMGERIRHIRKLRGMTQEELGRKIRMSEKTAGIRLTQYETGTRTPREGIINDLAHALGVAPEALSVPDIDTIIGLAHTLFALEDTLGFEINKLDGRYCLTLDRHKARRSLFELFQNWYEENAKLKNNEITEEDYNEWRYTYPRLDAERFKAQRDEIRAKKKAEQSEG